MNKTRLPVCIAALLSAISCTSQDNTYTVQGKITNVKDGAKVYLFSHPDNPSPIPADSTYIKNNQFVFKGTVNNPFRAFIVVRHDEGEVRRALDILDFYVEKGKIQLNASDSIKHATISGSPLSDQLKQFVELTKTFEKEKFARRDFIMAATEEERNSADFMENFFKISLEIVAREREMIVALIKQYPDSQCSFDYLFPSYLSAGPEPDVFEVESVFSLFSERLKNTLVGKEYAKKIDELKKTSIGATAPDFTQNDPDGKPVKLSDFRGKYVLLDFWASWCGPCRMENPNVVAAYEAFKDKGFTVLGVSLDDGNRNGRADWLKAIKDDKLTWTHVSDLKFWNNEVSVAYGIGGIPANFLIDPNGKIIAKNLRGKALIEKLSQVLK